ncbi:hypothetical protein BC826DRAFT_973049, partial [Russula brevipes]
MPPTDKPTPPAWRTHIPSVLTVLAHGSAPFITTFLFVHLAAPAAGNIGGSADASRTMMFGREYYRTPSASGTSSLRPCSCTARARSSSAYFPLPLPPPCAASAAALERVVDDRLRRHALPPPGPPAHAPLRPASPDPPISSLSPSELDFEYVKAALRGWPVRTTVLYGALVLAVALHAADGFGVIWSTWGAKAKLPRRRARQALAGAG